MHADRPTDRRLERLIGTVLDAETGPHPVWGASPAARRIGSPARTRSGRGSLRLLAIAALLTVGVAAAALVAGPPNDLLAGAQNGWVAFTIGDLPGIHLVREGMPARAITATDTPGLVEECPAFSPDGRRLAYGQATGSIDAGYRAVALVIADLASDGTIVSSKSIPLDGAGAPPCGTWSSDGRWIATGVRIGDPDGVAGTADEVWVVDLHTDAVRRLPAMTATDLEWTPDGSELIIAADRILRYRVATDDLLPLGTATGVEFLSVSPDGRRLAYERPPDWSAGQSDAKELVVSNLDGTSATIVASGYWAFHGIGPVWSPDGDSIVHQRVCAGRPSGDPAHPEPLICREQHEAAVVDITTGPDGVTATERVIRPPRTEGANGLRRFYPYSVTWSPDGRRLLYLAWSEGYDGTGLEEGGIVAVPVDGDGEPVLLASDPRLNVYANGIWLPFQSWGRDLP